MIGIAGLSQSPTASVKVTFSPPMLPRMNNPPGHSKLSWLPLADSSYTKAELEESVALSETVKITTRSIVGRVARVAVLVEMYIASSYGNC